MGYRQSPVPSLPGDGRGGRSAGRVCVAAGRPVKKEPAPAPTDRAPLPPESNAPHAADQTSHQVTLIALLVSRITHHATRHTSPLPPLQLFIANINNIPFFDARFFKSLADPQFFQNLLEALRGRLKLEIGHG